MVAVTARGCPVSVVCKETSRVTVCGWKASGDESGEGAAGEAPVDADEWAKKDDNEGSQGAAKGNAWGEVAGTGTGGTRELAINEGYVIGEE